jgi:serine/threonine-protein kinase RsbW
MKKNIVLKNDLSEIQRLKQEITDLGKRIDLSGEVLYDIRLALEEAITNIISYAFDDDSEHRIDITIEARADMLIMAIEDDGRSFNPTEYYNADLEKPFDERGTGGMGIHILRTLMDKVEYKLHQGRNVLIIRKNL